MRILFVTPYYFPEVKFGGPPKKIRSLARGLTDLGHFVSILTFDSENRSRSDKIEIDGISVQYLPWIGRGLKQLPMNLELIRNAITQSDLVHCYGLYNLVSPIAAWITTQLRRPLVNEPLGMFPPRARSRAAKEIFNAVITRRMLRASNLVLAASENEARDLSQMVEPRNIAVRRNGIDLSEFARLPSADRIRNQWGIGSSERVILYLGRISPIKNLEQLVVAFGAANLPDVRLLLVGPLSEPAYEKQIRRVIQAQELEKTVSLTGPVYGEDQKAAFALADFVVLPSLNESFGNAAAEAVAADVPVLLTETCGIAPMIHRRAGLAVPVGLESLREGLKMMSDPQSRARLTAQIDEVKRELSWEEPVRQTEQMYSQIIAAFSSMPNIAAAV